MEKIVARERTNYSENISIKLVIPGSCNARCSFCYMGRAPKTKTCDSGCAFIRNYLKSIEYLVDKIGGEHPVSLDITGNEPTLDAPFLNHVLWGIKLSGLLPKINRVVLTTNGTNLWQCLPSMDGVVDYVNISVHDYDLQRRHEVFGFAIQDARYRLLVSGLKSIGIDTSAVAVIHKPIDAFRTWLHSFMDWCKDKGFIALRLRCDVFWEEQQQFDHYANRTTKDPLFRLIDGGNTPDSKWCRLRDPDGFRVFFLHGVADTSLVSPGVEYIVADDGKAYADYGKLKPIEQYPYPIGKVFDLEKVDIRVVGWGSEKNIEYCD